LEILQKEMTESAPFSAVYPDKCLRMASSWYPQKVIPRGIGIFGENTNPRDSLSFEELFFIML